MGKKSENNSSGGWRYQAVYSENRNDMGGTYCCFTICEVYLDKDGKLEAWTEDSSITPSGDSIDELNHDLQFMLEDIAKWEPVPFKSLQIGMTFEQN